MNAHERGKRLSRAVTGTIGLLAVIAASALGLHDWADTVATKAAAGTTSQVTQPSTGDGASVGEGDGEGDDEGSSDGGSASTPLQNVAPVSPGNGQAPHATTNGS